MMQQVQNRGTLTERFVVPRHADMARCAHKGPWFELGGCTDNPVTVNGRRQACLGH